MRHPVSPHPSASARFANSHNATSRNLARRYMHEAWAATTASSPCICSWVNFRSIGLPPGWVAALDLRMPSMAPARLSAGSLAEMQSHVFWLVVTRHSFMKSSARAAPARLAPRTQTTRLKHTARIDLLPESPPLPAPPTRQYRGHVRLFKGLGWTHL